MPTYDRYIPQLQPAVEGAPTVSLQDMQEQFRRVWEVLAKLEGRLGPINLLDSVDILGSVTSQSLTVDGNPMVAFEGCVVTNSTNQLAANATYTTLGLNTQEFDNANMFDPGGAPTIPRDGLYIIGGAIVYDTSAVGGRFVAIQVDGHGIVAESGVGTSTAAYGEEVAICAVKYLTAGNVVRLRSWQDSGGPLAVLANNFSPRLFVARFA